MSLEQDNVALKHLEPETPEIELMKFIKYPKLVPILKDHILSYLHKPTLAQYAECSKICNAEVQRFNIVAPCELYLDDQNDGVIFKLLYPTKKPRLSTYDKSHHPTVERKFLLADGFQEAQNFLLKYYKFVRVGKTQMVYINMKHWPKEILDVKVLRDINYWIVTMHESTLDGFMEHSRQNGARIEKAIIKKGSDENVAIPSEFFTNSKNLQRFTALVPCSIETQDFVDLHASSLRGTFTIDFEAIRQRVERINADPSYGYQDFSIRLPDDDSRIFDLSVLFPLERFPNQFINWRRSLQMGRVEIWYPFVDKSLRFCVPPKMKRKV